MTDIKPKMAEGSRCITDGTVMTRSWADITASEGKLRVGAVGYGGHSVICTIDAHDVIRALYEGGPLRTLWGAAVRVYEARGVDVLTAVNSLCRVIDEMKESDG